MLHLVCAKFFSKHIDCINSFTPHPNPMWRVLLAHFKDVN